MVVDTFEMILTLILGLSCIAFVFWWVIYTTKSSLSKQNKELKSELDDLKIVNSNLAKYNDTLLKEIKK